MKRGKTTKQKIVKAEKPRESITGTYVYDSNLDEVVKISDRIPSVASKSSGPAPSGQDCGSCCNHGCPRKK